MTITKTFSITLYPNSIIVRYPQIRRTSKREGLGIYLIMVCITHSPRSALLKSRRKFAWFSTFSEVCEHVPQRHAPQGSRSYQFSCWSSAKISRIESCSDGGNTILLLFPRNPTSFQNEDSCEDIFYLTSYLGCYCEIISWAVVALYCLIFSDTDELVALIVTCHDELPTVLISVWL